MTYDLNDARVDALRIATEAGLTVDQFNAIWLTLMRGLGLPRTRTLEWTHWPYCKLHPEFQAPVCGRRCRHDRPPGRGARAGRDDVRGGVMRPRVPSLTDTPFGGLDPAERA